ncbi:MAG TPA: hypothetical protein V6D47_09275, partial [Oscillatoriaceae cyanobacterium]
LRGVVHVSREHTPIITLSDRLSTETTDALAALISMRGFNEGTTEKVKAVPRHELPTIMDKLLERAKEEQEWGKPAIAFPLLTVAKVDSDQAKQFANFLMKLPGAQVKAPIVPLIQNEPWAVPVLAKWEAAADVSDQVKKAIKMGREGM